MKSKQKLLRGRCSWRVLPGLEICETIFCSGCITWTLRFLTTSFELREVDSSAFCHRSPRPAPPAPQSLLHNLRRRRSPSRRPAQGYVSFFCVLSHEHLSIDRPVCPFVFAWPASSSVVLVASSAILPLYF